MYGLKLKMKEAAFKALHINQKLLHEEIKELLCSMHGSSFF